MRTFKLVVTWSTLSLLAITAFAEKSGSTSPEGMGFYSLDVEDIPQAVKDSAKSVFKIAVPAGKRVPVQQIFGEQSLEDMMTKLQNMPISESVTAIDKAIFAVQIYDCIQQKTVACQVFQGVSTGTAFVTGDGQDLRTAFHVVEDLAKFDDHEKRLNPRRSATPINILLVNSDGQAVRSPADLGAIFKSVPSRALRNDLYKDRKDHRVQFNDDQVLIRLRVPVATPIPIAKVSSKPGDIAFIAGVPHQTQDRRAFRLPDSDGMTVRASKGTILGTSELSTRLRQSGLDVDKKFLEESLLNAVALTADGAPGLSGGPILNTRGEIIAIYTAAVPQSGVAYPLRVSYGGSKLIP